MGYLPTVTFREKRIQTQTGIRWRKNIIDQHMKKQRPGYKLNIKLLHQVHARHWHSAVKMTLLTQNTMSDYSTHTL